MVASRKWLSAGLTIALLPLGLAGCAKVSVEGGEKPIHIVMDINLKIDRELDQFFAFEKQPTTNPATRTAAGQ
jgi:hypothetical protein